MTYLLDAHKHTKKPKTNKNALFVIQIEHLNILLECYKFPFFISFTA